MNGFIAKCLAVLFAAASVAQAGAFMQSSGTSLVVVRLGEESAQWQPNSSTTVYLDEYDVTQQTPKLVNTVVMPAAGKSVCTLTTNIGWHDGNLHVSTNGQYLTMAGYRYDVGGPYDPADEIAKSVPRVIARVDMSGNVDTSTALTDNCDYGAIRSVVTDDGTRFWTAGDNAGGANDGGLRLALLGASISINLSHNQTHASPHAPKSDNPRDIGIYAGQLYVCSGSSDSIGKAVFKYGDGLPVETNGDYSRITTDNASVQSFVFLDLDADVPGVDTLYTASSTGGTLRKYSLVDGVWITKGLMTVPGIEKVTAWRSDGTVVLYVATNYEVFRITDKSGYNKDLSGVISTPCIVAGVNRQFRGIELLHHGR